MRYEIDETYGTLGLDATMGELVALASLLFADHCSASVAILSEVCEMKRNLSSFVDWRSMPVGILVPADNRQAVLSVAIAHGLIERQYRFHTTVNVQPDCSACDDGCMIAGEWDYSDDATPTVDYYWLAGEPNPNDYATVVDADGTFRVGDGTLVSANDGDDRLYIWEFHAPAEADRYGHPMTARTTHLVSAEDGAAIVFTPR